MQPFLICLAAVAVALFTTPARGGFLGSNQMSINFTKQADAVSKATWSHPEKLAITAQGLGWDAQGAEVIEGCPERMVSPCQNLRCRPQLEPPLAFQSQIARRTAARVRERLGPELRFEHLTEVVFPRDAQCRQFSQNPSGEIGRGRMTAEHAENR